MNKLLFTPALTGSFHRFLNVKIVWIAVLLCCFSIKSFGQVSITPGTGGTGLCASSGACNLLGSITVTETSAGNISSGSDVITLVPPAGWQFCSVPITCTPTSGGDIATVTASVTSTTTITINISATGTSHIDAFSITGIKVQPLVSGAVAGNITASSATGVALPASPNFASLSPSPLPITGISNVCVAASIGLADGTGGGAWTSSAAGIATVTGTGVVGGASAGVATITYSASGCYTTHSVTVGSPAPITGPSAVCVGATINLADLSGSGAPAVGTWTISTPAVATISFGAPVSSTVGGASVGTATVTYTYSAGCYSTYLVSVYPTIPAITVPRSPICVNDTETFSIGITGGTWSSTPVGSLALDPITGHATATASNVVTVIYTLGCSRTATLQVNPIPTITGPLDVCEGDNVTYVASPSTYTSWVSSVPAVMAIDSFTGNATAGTGGYTYISYTNRTTGCVAYITVDVHDSAWDLTGPDSLCMGTTGDYITEPAPGASGTWSSLYTSVATIDPSGYITTVGPGMDTISYVTPGCPTKSIMLRVDPLPAPITGSSSLCLGSTLTLTDTSPGGSWLSTDMSVATIDGTGLVTDVDPTLGATTTISYTLPTGCTTSLPITVNYGPTAIFGTDTVCQGGSLTLHDTTSGGLWSSTLLAVAQVIDSSGVVTGVSAGTAVISYTLSNGCFQAYPFRVVNLTPALLSVATSPGTTVCAGSMVSFSVTATNAGTPTFEWHKFYLGYPALGSSNVFSDTFTHGDVVIVEAFTHGVCATHDTVMDTIAMNVIPDVMPYITITKNTLPDTLEYPGQVFTFNSTATWGGTNPRYQWFVNGSPINGATSSTFAAAVYANDTFMCRLISNAPCSTHDTVFSSYIPIYGAWLAVNSVKNNSAFTLFPNPSNGTLTLSGNTEGQVNIEVSDMLGHTVYKGTAIAQNGMINERISLSNSPPAGTYIMRLGSDQVNETFHFVIDK